MKIKEKELIELIQEIIETHKEIDMNDSLIYDIGLSSFEMCMLACEIEERFNKNVDYKMFKNFTTVKDLYNLLQQ